MARLDAPSPTNEGERSGSDLRRRSDTLRLVPRTRSSRTPCGKCDRELRVQRGTRIIELLVVLRFRSSYLSVPRVLTNFGIGPLGRLSQSPIPLTSRAWRVQS